MGSMNDEKKEPLIMGIIFIIAAGILPLILGIIMYISVGDELFILLSLVGVFGGILGVFQIKKRLR